MILGYVTQSASLKIRDLASIMHNLAHKQILKDGEDAGQVVGAGSFQDVVSTPAMRGLGRLLSGLTDRMPAWRLTAGGGGEKNYP